MILNQDKDIPGKIEIHNDDENDDSQETENVRK